jgi:hypothetical protein
VKHIESLAERDKAGKKRISDWQEGWKSNSTNGTLIPGYFGKYPIIRMGGNFVTSTNNKSFELEYFAFVAIQRYIFQRYIPTVEHVYEFGCGTGHNLLRISGANQQLKSIVGLDWVNSTLDNVVSIQKFLGNVSGEKFNMFEPDHSYRLEENSAVCTIASMEQLGNNFQEFFHYLLSNKPRYVIHIEPINELLGSESSLLDYLSVNYAKKRNYLNGYLDYLRIMEDAGLIDIVYLSRSYVGSLFIDGYSVIVWECC